MRYGELSLRSKTGLNEVYLVSNCGALEAFQQALRRYTNALPRSNADDKGSSEVPYDAIPDLEIPAIARPPSLHTAGSTIKFLLLAATLAVTLYATQEKWLPLISPQTAAETAGTAPEVAMPLSTQAPIAPVSTEPLTAAPLPPTESAPSTLSDADETPGRPLKWNEVVNLQKRLARLGYQPGPPDGELGRRTLDAFNQWRILNGRPSLSAIGDTAYTDFLKATQ